MPIMRGMTVSDWDYAIPEHWATGVRIDGVRKAMFSQFEGREGSNKPIIRRDDLTKDPGDKINIQLATALYGVGVTGESTLEGSEEKLTLAQMSVTVDWFRNAVAFNLKGQKQVNFNMVNMIGGQLSDWMGRELDNRLLVTVAPPRAAVATEPTSPSTTMYAGSVTFATLDPADYFQTEELQRIRAQLEHQGCKPFMVQRQGGQEIPLYAVVISDYDAYYLATDVIWTAAQREAQLRGEKNPIFTRALGMYMGMIVYVYTAPGTGIVQGSAIRPETLVGSAVAGSDTVIYCNAAEADDGKDYTKHFPTAGVISITAGTGGTAEVIAYTAKNRYSFTATAAQIHGVGAIITSASATTTYATAVSKCLAFGSEMAIRGWGLHPRRITNARDYGFERGLGIEAMEGVSIVEDTNGNHPNCLVMYAASPAPVGT